MLLNKFIQAFQLGRIHKSDCLDYEFLLERFECKSENVFTIQGQEPHVPPLSIRFCRVPRQEHIYALACEDGNINFMNSNSSAKKSCIKSWTAHKNAVFDLFWLRQSNHLITVSGDKTTVLWDTTTLEKVSTFEGHTGSVKTVCPNPVNEGTFATGSRDGTICLWDSRISSGLSHKPVCSILGAYDSGREAGRMNSIRERKRRRKGILPPLTSTVDSISCVLFANENTLLSTGASDWSIKGWDVRRLSSKRQLNGTAVPLFNINNAVKNYKSHGYTSLVLNPDGRTFFANCTDGTISQYAFGSKTPQLVSTYYGHLVETFFVKMDISCDGKFLVSGSSDEKAYIWKVSKPGVPIVSLEGHDAEVTVVAWHPTDITKLITCGDDENVFNWTVGDLSVKMNDGLNPVVAKSQFVNAENVRHPSSAVTPRHFKVSTPTTPSSSKNLRPPLTQWFTPKGKLSLSPRCKLTPGSVLQSSSPENKTLFTLNNNEVTPTTSAINAEAVTPVKVPIRSILGNLSNSEEIERLGTSVESIRRSINFGHCNDQITERNRTVSHRSVKKSKTNKGSPRSRYNKQPSNYSIKKFFLSEPRSSPGGEKPQTVVCGTPR